MDDIVNNIEIRVIGLKRSGNHVIINWLIPHYKGKVCFLNNVEPIINPFLTFHNIVDLNKNLYKDFDIDKEKNGKFSKKDCLIYSYEDGSFKKVLHKKFEKNYDKFVGRSKKRYNILILRDPFNLFASRIFRYHNLYGGNVLKEIRAKKLWKSYAREYLGETSYLGKDKILINYNVWFLNKDYRNNIERKLELEPSNEKVNEVLTFGEGSSFDGVKFDGKANEMKVLERWKLLADDEFYKFILKDKELVELSNRIFGRIPGTEKITKNKRFQATKLFYTEIKGIMLYLKTNKKIRRRVRKIKMKVRKIKKKAEKIINYIDSVIGLFGLFLKKNFPRLYYYLKKVKK